MVKTTKSILLVSVAIAATCPVYAAVGEATAGSHPAVLRETVIKGAARATQDSSVESFFQIDPKKRNSEQSLMEPETLRSSTADKNKSTVHGMYRFVWHILDNAGIPMFFGQDSGLDPDLGDTYLIPAPKLPRERDLRKQLEKASTAANPIGPHQTSITAKTATQKLPESELEGVTLPALRDDTHASTP